MKTVPMEGMWYRAAGFPQAFQVVAVDRDSESVDIETFDGTVDEWTLAHWAQLNPESCEAPQDGSGPYDSRDGGIDDLADEAIALVEPIERAHEQADEDLLELQARDFAEAHAVNLNPLPHRKRAAHQSRHS
jgi:hypothetical protein